MPDKPLRDGADVSWIRWCKPGDNQGHSLACGVFAIANWVEVMLEDEIADDTCIAAWRDERRRVYGNLGGGLWIPEAFEACQRARIVPAGYEIAQARDLTAMYRAPLIATYRTTVGWNHTNAAGCIEHNGESDDKDHAVLAVAWGGIGAAPVEQRIVWTENSWGAGRGYHGYFVMLEQFHKKHCSGLWEIRRGA